MLMQHFVLLEYIAMTAWVLCDTESTTISVCMTRAKYVSILNICNEVSFSYKFFDRDIVCEWEISENTLGIHASCGLTRNWLRIALKPSLKMCYWVLMIAYWSQNRNCDGESSKYEEKQPQLF